MMLGNFRFNPIGQGLFYSGFIYGINDKKFSIVYDCGSDSKMKYLYKEIDNFKNYLKENAIDLLVVSHFDRDHINGLERLLEGTKVKTVVIPYYTPAERLALIDVEQIFDISAEDEFYIRFLSNPYNFFRQENARIVFLGDNDNVSNEVKKINLDELEEVDDCRSNKGTEDEIKPIGNRVSFQSKQVNWEFLIYNVKPDKTRLEEYYNFITELLIENENSLEKLLSNKTSLNQILEKKKRLMPMGKSNYNSVVMYHAPMQNNKLFLKNFCCHMDKDCNHRLQYHCNRCFDFCDCGNCCCKLNGTLLTGDLDCLHKEMSNIKEFIEEARYDNINILLVPHHGATDRYYINYNFPNCIISYGLKNRHGHLTAATLKKIASCNTDLHLVNEEKAFDYLIATR